jgi:DNA end-binding protein Ku
MRAIWKGAISFGLVNIPISLYSATRPDEEISFRQLRRSDLSPIKYKRVAEADGKEVPWDEIVKGYEYQKDEFVVLTDDDLKSVDIESTQTVDIMNFVPVATLNPLLFYKPYFMECGKGGDKAYVLLRDALQESGKIAITKVVLKTRQHLAAIKPEGNGLMLELMHFPHEVLNSSDFKTPDVHTVTKPEMKMALQLIDSMSTEWNPADYKDEYREALEAMIAKKTKGEGKPAAAARKKATTTNVIDLADVLQRSIQEAGSHSRKSKTTRKGVA